VSAVERQPSIARERAEAIAEIVEYTVGELRRARKITQDELARLLATTQPNVSRIEHGGEMELSTLRGYIEALGGGEAEEPAPATPESESEPDSASEPAAEPDTTWAYEHAEQMGVTDSRA
jgi:transcriptional regulator with XRE-family HTH domain